LMVSDIGRMLNERVMTQNISVQILTPKGLFGFIVVPT